MHQQIVFCHFNNIVLTELISALWSECLSTFRPQTSSDVSVHMNIDLHTFTSADQGQPYVQLNSGSWTQWILRGLVMGLEASVPPGCVRVH